MNDIWNDFTAEWNATEIRIFIAEYLAHHGFSDVEVILEW
jgi:hypothetical protein